MPIITTNPIESGDVGSVWYNKVNTNTDNIASALQSCSEIGHKHIRNDITNFSHTHTVSEITDFATQTYTGSQITVTQESTSKTLQSALDTLYSYISGMTVTASINNISFDGSDANSGSVVVSIGVSATAFGVFSVTVKWSNNPEDIDFSGLRVRNGNSSDIVLPKPSSGWDSNNQQYLHIKAIFTNMASQASIPVYAHQLVTKYNKDITAQEIADIIVGTPSFMQAVASDIASRRSFRSDIATRVNDL